jgi:2-(1,2-epoxy-1,2-dihydrophenyl)acetyl-CoA isomerase
MDWRSTVTVPTILFEIEAETGVAVLTLNRPDRLNSFTRAMIGEWRRALEHVEGNSDIRALIVTGAGKAFCAGADVEELDSFLRMDALGRKSYLWQHVHQIGMLLERIDCPVLAAVNGTARGAGLDMALMCDLRIFDETAVVAQSYIDMGLMPGDGGAWFLPRLVGPAVALELMWTGDAIDAQTALRMGIASRVAAAGTALAETLTLARRIAAQPTEAVRFTKRSVYQAMAGMSLRNHFDTVSSHMSVLQDLPAFRERVAVFLERSARRKAAGNQNA